MMMANIEAALYPLVVNFNNYLSSYILVFLLVAVGVWYTIKTRFVQIRYFTAGLKKVFGGLSLKGTKHENGMTSFQALATAIAAIRRELGTKWAAGVVLWQCFVAWLAAFVAYIII